LDAVRPDATIRATDRAGVREIRQTMPTRRLSPSVPIALLLFAVLALSSASAAAQGHGPAQPPAGAAAAVEHSGEAAHGSEHPIRDVVARLFNFGVLVGALVYFLKAPIAGHLRARSAQIRQDLLAAAEMRRSATAQLDEVQQKLNALPAELAALKTRGEEDVQAEKQRIAEAAALERERLLDQTRREIEMRLRMARRELTEYAAALAVSVARERITRTITPDDQLRLVDRYTTQLKEAR
jgi:F0F1-type ATP synthase membrane subunit b/b'